jgi:site-specific recombinase XerC
MIIICSDKVKTNNDIVKSKNSKHHAKEFVCASISLFKNFIPNLSCKSEVGSLSSSKILGFIDDKRENVEIRRHFYAEEIQKMFEIAKTNIRNTLVLRILCEIGLRVGALAKLRVRDFINEEGVCKRECKVLEKGNKFRLFPTSEVLRQDIEKYLIDCPSIVSSEWLFPSSKGTKYLSTQAIREIIKTIAKEAEVYGPHIHPHAFRHTIVNTLINTGNEMEKVSRFMGHSSSSTTEQYYWTSNLSDVVPTMNIPWLNTIFEEDEDDNYEFPKDLLINIILTYNSLLTYEQKIEIKKKIPNIDIIFKMMVEYSISSSSCSLSTT